MGGGVEMKIEKVSITPEIAADMLSRNYANNRKVRPRNVETLADVMRRGLFYGLNGQTIVVDKNGTLLDGQHRLLAVVKSGTTQEFLVATVDNGTVAFKTLDGGSGRKVSDYVTSGYKNEAAAATSMMYCIENGVAPLASTLQGKITAKMSASRIDLVNYYEANKELVNDVCDKTMRIYRGVGCGARSIYSAFVYLVEYCDRDEMLERFIEEMSDCTSLHPTIVAVKNGILRKKVACGSNSIDNRWLLGMMLDAYDSYAFGSGKALLNKSSQKFEIYDKLLATKRAEKRGVTCSN